MQQAAQLNVVSATTIPGCQGFASKKRRLEELPDARIRLILTIDPIAGVCRHERG
jgi:hypothetical protein